MIHRWNSDVVIYKLDGNEFKSDGKLEHEGWFNDIHDMSISPDGRTLLVGFGQSDYRVWDFPNKTMVRDIKGQAISHRTDTTTHAVWTPDG